MAWSDDPKVHAELKGYMDEIIGIDDRLTRLDKAARTIAYCSAYGHPVNYLGTLALCALYPQDFRTVAA